MSADKLSDKKLAVSEQRAAEAAKEWGENALTIEQQREENSKIVIEPPERGGIARGSTGAPIQEGGSGRDGGVI